MRRKILSLIVAVLGVAALFATPAVAEGRYVVLFENNQMPKNTAALIEKAGGVLVREIPEVGIAIAISNDEDFAETISGVNKVKLAGVVPAESLPETKGRAFGEDGPTANDWIYNYGLQWNINRVHAPEAWSAGFTGSHDTVVAVIDTGIAWNVPDLSPNVVFAACITHASGCNPYPDVDIHGTHVAGIIASAFDGGGTVGVAPNLALASYKTFEDIEGCGYCTYTDSRWLAMIDAAQRGFEVINMSLGGYGIYGGQGTNGLAAFVAAEKRVAGYVNMMGTTIVASAGNEAVDLNGTIIHLPGDIPNIINVSATGIRPDIWTPYPESYDIPAFYSNYGAPVTVAAPGGDAGPDFPIVVDWSYAVASTGASLEPGCAQTCSCTEEYWYMIGTSQAAPHVAAVAGLIKDINPKLSPNQVEAIIKRSAEDLGNRQLFGHGMVDAFEAAMAAE